MDAENPKETFEVEVLQQKRRNNNCIEMDEDDDDNDDKGLTKSGSLGDCMLYVCVVHRDRGRAGVVVMIVGERRV